jgi:carbon-monoxide dehydrogenase small subunit
MSGLHTIEAVINGEPYRGSVPARKLLSDFIREDLRLTGTHVGCEHGVCGSCTVLLDGRPVRSCLMFAPQADGASIETIEALASGPDDLHPIQQAFWDHHGLQCGFCTPGMVLTAKALLDEVPNPTEDQIREAISGNICRCTGYVFIVDAIKAASEMLAPGEAPAGQSGPHDD